LIGSLELRENTAMTLRTLALALLLAAPAVRAADTPYAVKVATNAPPPAEVQEAVRKQMTDRCVQLVNAKGDLLAELWLRKEVPVKANQAQAKNGLSYRDLGATALIGVMRLARPFSDYRKQKVMPGVYTLRLAYQPMDGDHQGTAPHSEFCLLSPAAEDKSPATMTAKDLQDMSAKSTNAHPAVLLLFPGKGAVAEPTLVSKGNGHWVVLLLLDVKAGDKTMPLPFGLTLIGASSAA
jgi:hypothetical protein